MAFYYLRLLAAYAHRSAGALRWPRLLLGACGVLLALLAHAQQGPASTSFFADDAGARRAAATSPAAAALAASRALTLDEKGLRAALAAAPLERTHFPALSGDNLARCTPLHPSAHRRTWSLQDRAESALLRLSTCLAQAEHWRLDAYCLDSSCMLRRFGCTLRRLACWRCSCMLQRDLASRAGRSSEYHRRLLRTNNRRRSLHRAP